MELGQILYRKEYPSNWCQEQQRYATEVAIKVSNWDKLFPFKYQKTAKINIKSQVINRF